MKKHIKKHIKKHKKNYIYCLVVFLIPIIFSLIGMDNNLINWTFLLLFFGTTIGSNFFDKSLVKDRFSEDITEDNLILRKISFYIGMVFLYIYVYISDKVINSTFYYIHSTRSGLSVDELDSIHPIRSGISGDVIDSIKLFSDCQFMNDITTKMFIFIIVFATYWETHKKILYYIFRFIYIDKKIANRSNLVKVIKDGGRWKVVEKDVLATRLPSLEIVSIDTFQIKGNNRDTYYVAQKSEIHETIDGVKDRTGYRILGVINRDKYTIFIFLAMLCILPTFYFLDYTEKIDDGMYKIVSKSGEAEVPNEIEVSGDAIVYKDKVEAYDKRTQSFEHGTISLRKKGEHSIELIENIGDKTIVKYQKK